MKDGTEILRTPKPERALEHANRIAAAKAEGKLHLFHDGDRVAVEADAATIAAINRDHFRFASWYAVVVNSPIAKCSTKR